MDKPFTSIDEQVALLNRRGVSTDGDTPRILMREGYYSVVNGYKDPFIDSEKTEECHDDRYLSGTSFADIYQLFSFDRALRETTFHYLIRVEALVRTACAYCFSEAHSEHDDYLRFDSYTTEAEYTSFGLKDHAKSLVKLTSTLQNRAMNSESEFIRHYRDQHGSVPLWVLANDLTFGNVQYFYNLMKPEERKRVCRHISIATGKTGSGSSGYFDPVEARASIDYLVKFRNSCAHDDRLYCAKVGPHRECDYATMLKRIGRFLPVDEYQKMLDGVINLLATHASTSPVMRHLIENMGFKMEERDGSTYVSFK